MKYSKLIKWLVTLVAIVLIGFAVYLRLKPEANTGPKGPTEQAVTLISPQQRDVPYSVELNGNVVPLKVVDVHAQVANLVKEVLIKEGQFVKAGQPMFLLDDSADKANVEKLRAQLARDKALGLDQTRQHKRSAELREQNFISQGALDTAEAQKDAQWALVKSDEAALLAAEVALGYNTVKAPISGRTGVVNVFPGTLVQPATTSMVVVTQIDPIGVQFNVPEVEFAKLQSALNHSASGAGSVKVSIPGTQLAASGQLYFVDNAVDSTAGTIKTRAVFSNPKQELWPGQFVQTRIDLGVLKNAVVLPSNAILTSTNGTFVYTVGDDLIVKQVPVKTVYIFGESSVVEGLNPQDKVVMDGRQNLRPGNKVRVIVPAESKK